MEYTVQESISKRKLDLQGQWDSLFLPGRRVNMSMVFHQPQTSMSTCPGCQTENEVESGGVGSEDQWYVVKALCLNAYGSRRIEDTECLTIA